MFFLFYQKGTTADVGTSYFFFLLAVAFMVAIVDLILFAQNPQ